MAIYRLRVPWMFSPLICLTSSCSPYPWNCPLEIGLYVNTAELLLIDSPPQDSAGDSLMLRIEGDLQDPDEVCEEPLVNEDGEGFRYDSPSRCDVGTGEWIDKVIKLKDVTVSFDLMWQGEFLDRETFPTVKVEGGQTSADLWNGWTLALTWWGPDTDCK